MIGWYVLFVVIGGISFWTLWYFWRKPKKARYKKPLPPVFEPVMGQPIEMGVDPFLPKKKTNPFGDSQILDELQRNPPDRLGLEPIDD